MLLVALCGRQCTRRNRRMQQAQRKPSAVDVIRCGHTIIITAAVRCGASVSGHGQRARLHCVVAPLCLSAPRSDGRSGLGRPGGRCIGALRIRAIFAAAQQTGAGGGCARRIVCGGENAPMRDAPASCGPLPMRTCTRAVHGRRLGHQRVPVHVTDVPTCVYVGGCEECHMCEVVAQSVWRSIAGARRCR